MSATFRLTANRKSSSIHVCTGKKLCITFESGRYVLVQIWADTYFEISGPQHTTYRAMRFQDPEDPDKTSYMVYFQLSVATGGTTYEIEYWFDSRIILCAMEEKLVYRYTREDSKRYTLIR